MFYSTHVKSLLLFFIFIFKYVMIFVDKYIILLYNVYDTTRHNVKVIMLYLR